MSDGEISMLKAEVKYFLKHKFLVLVMAVLIFVPSIYAITFLSSLWDPYGAIKNLPVAVVNQDQPVTYQKHKFAVGQDMQLELKQSTAMDFHVVSAQQAQTGLKSGKYYMVLTIPKNFSANATTLLNATPKRMQLKYETSSGHSFIAGKLTNSGAQTVAQKISTQISKTYTQTLLSSFKKVGVGMQTAADGNAALVDGTKQLNGGVQQLTTNMDQLATGAAQANSGSATLTSGIGQYTHGVDTAATGAKQLADGLQALDSKLTTSDVSGKLAAVSADLTTLQSGLDQLKQALPAGTTLASLVKGLDQQLDQMQTAVAQLPAQQKAAATGDQQTLTANLTQAAITTQMTPTQVAAVQDAIAKTQANSQSNQLAAGLTKQLQGFAQQIELIQPVLEFVATNGAQLTGLDVPAIQQQIDQAQALPGAVDQLNNGAATLSSGLDTLSSQSSKLNNGATDLQTGIGQLASGSTQLATGTDKLTPAVQKLTDGNQLLVDKLDAGANSVSDVPDNKGTIKALAAPLTTKHVERDTVANNGTGMAPYMFSVGLFVGMLAFNLMMDMASPRKKITTWWAWMLSKLAILFTFALAAALVVYGLSVWLLGMQVVNPLGTLGVVVAIAFMDAALVTALYVWFDKVGAFIAMVLLVIQLSGAAGTYPIQLSNGFFETIHPWLPMTYAVDGLREGLMIGNSVWPDIVVMVGIGLIFTMIMGIFYASQRRKYSMLTISK